MTTPHVPQIPSRQSWSKAIGSSRLEDQIFVDGIQHFQERHVRADVRWRCTSGSFRDVARLSAATLGG